MDLHDQVPVRIRHILEADIPKDAGVVYEDVYPTEGLDGCVDDCFAILDAVVVRDRFPAGGFDLLNDYIGGLQLLSAYTKSSEDEESNHLVRLPLALERAP